MKILSSTEEIRRINESHKDTPEKIMQHRSCKENVTPEMKGDKARSISSKRKGVGTVMAYKRKEEKNVEEEKKEEKKVSSTHTRW